MTKKLSLRRSYLSIQAVAHNAIDTSYHLAHTLRSKHIEEHRTSTLRFDQASISKDREMLRHCRRI